MSKFRLVTVASLVGAALLVNPLAAQTAKMPDGGTKPPAAAAATSNKSETVEERISTLKAALKITPDQETKWGAVADTMRQNAGMMDKLISEKRAKMSKMSAVDDLKVYQELAEAHLDGLKRMTSAFKSLYDSMPAEQKANADTVFANFGPAKTAKQG